MNKNIRNNYKNTKVTLDNNEFSYCTFENCVMEFAGTGPVALTNCTFNKVSWTFSGPAENTLKFMKAMYHGMGEGGRQVIEKTFEEIKTNKQASKTELI